MQTHGATLNAVLAIAAVVLVALVPSRLEDELRDLEERLHSPLDNFRQVFSEAMALLESIRDDGSSSFRMVAASAS
jgi:hypothetical protein